jgi:isoquinoline 1-oxidoreductase alpha subunit
MIELTVNGETHELDADPGMPLLWALRDHLGLTGTKYGCGAALCGACTVHVDGRPRRSCVTTLRVAAGKDIRTIEGLQGPVAKAVQGSWERLNVVQCGYCQSGQIMAAVSLLEGNPRPGPAEIDDAMSGNLCRCATYARIRDAIGKAAEQLAAGEPG